MALIDRYRFGFPASGDGYILYDTKTERTWHVHGGKGEALDGGEDMRLRDSLRVITALALSPPVK